MTDERRERILAIAQELEDQGLIATNSSVYARALGHRGDVVQTMRDRRAAQRLMGGAVDVAEAEEGDDPEAPEATTTIALATDLRHLEAYYETMHQEWERLVALDQEGALSDQEMDSQVRLERRMASNLRKQQRLQPLLAAAQAREAVETGRQQHDAAIAQGLVLADATAQAFAHLAACLTAQVQHVDEQIDALALIRSRDGHQQFSLSTGREEVVNYVARLFGEGDFRSADTVRLLLDVPLTQGNWAQALANAPRLQPFPPRLIERFLAERHPETYREGA
jgi:hypothetical protein